MKYLPPKKLKILMGMFLGTGVLGMTVGLMLHQQFLTLFSVINFCLGGFFGYRFFTQESPSPEKRKK